MGYNSLLMPERKMNETRSTVDAVSALERIRKAEEEAAALVRTAREKAGPELLQEAQAAARAGRDAVLEKARKDAEELVRAAVADAMKEAGAIRAETGREKDRLRAQAAPRLEAAAEEAERRLAALLEGGSV